MHDKIFMQAGREFYFDASHFLPGYKGKCEQLHGHTYRLEVIVEGEVDSEGMVVDFNEIKAVVKPEVLDVLDHSNLNEILENPTAENIAVWIHERLRKRLDVSCIRLWEGQGKWVEISGASKNKNKK